MDQERERIEADLRGLVKGEVHCDDVTLQMYSSDASIYEVRPVGVVRPRSTEDVVATVQYAADQDLPIHARGAGTGLAGESLGPGLIIDFSHSMRRILTDEGDVVRVQPGVVHANLNRELAKRQRVFGPEPANGLVSTMGSVIALDGSGSRWLKYGSARSRLESVQVVLGDGTVTELHSHHVAAARQSLQIASAAEINAGVHRRMSLVVRIADLLERELPGFQRYIPQTAVNNSGYHLRNLLDRQSGVLNLAQLIAGSEGTLALITEASVRTDPLPVSRGVALLFFDKLERAADAAHETVRLGVSACDLMDRRLLTLAREEKLFARLIPASAEAMLLVEVDGEQPSDVRDQLQNIVTQVERRKKLAFASDWTMDPIRFELFWSLSDQVVPRLYRLSGNLRPLPFIEDMAIPTEQLLPFLIDLQHVFKRHQVTASMFAHAGHGQLHIRPFLDLAATEDLSKLLPLATEAYEAVMKYDGTISGEHGDGLSRTWFVREQAGPLADIFTQIKSIFDPANLLNPGKVVTEFPQPIGKNLRPVVVSKFGNETAESETVAESAEPSREEELPTGQRNESPLELQLAWSPDDFVYETRNCNGCGRCRTESADTRMCPIFRYAPREEASPRAKANLLRAVLTGRLPAEELTSERLKGVADLCVNCHQCRLECPAHVDVPRLMSEAKAQYVAQNGLKNQDWLLTRVDWLASWAFRFRGIANWVVGNQRARWMMEKLFGIAQGRKLPRFAAQNFMRYAARHRLTRMAKNAARKVAVFVDVYANWFDPELAIAWVKILRHHGISIFVPPTQRPSGMNSIAVGAADHAKLMANRNVEVLAEAVRLGYRVVTTEPAAALCISHEYPQLLGADVDVELVAQNTTDACQYLWELHQQGELELDLSPVNASVAYHQPCMSRALADNQAGLQLLKLIPGLNARHIDRGCSGMAGIFGIKRENYRSSIRAGWGLISELRDTRIQLGTTECSTCKFQMEQGTEKPTIHPIKLLALSYGLMPEFAKLLEARGQDLVVT